MLAAPVAAAPVPDRSLVALSPDSEARWIPYVHTPGNQMRFTAELDGKPVTAILDTGASASMLSQDYAARSGRKVAPQGRVTAIGGQADLGWTPITLLTFGGLTRAGGGLNVVALPANVTGDDGTIDLLVGRDLLDRFALEVDPVGRRFRLLASGRMPFTGTRAPLSMGNVPPVYVTEITVAGQRLRPIVVDTGDGTSLTLSRGAWRVLPLHPYPAMTTQLTYGVGGPVEAEITRLPIITIGQRNAGDVATWVEPTGGFSDQTRAAGRIGMGLLQRYRMLLDPAAGHMILANADVGQPAPPSTSGLQLTLAGDRLQVVHVMRGSPAAEGGWRTGDTICAVDGASIAADPSAAQATWASGAPGTIVTLGLCDGTTRRLTLRRFY